MKDTRRQSQLSKKIKLEKGENYSVGVDLHKMSWKVVLFGVETGRLIYHWSMAPNREALLQLFQRLGRLPSGVYMEAGPTGFSLARYLLEGGITTVVVSPGHTPKTPSNQDKCDRLDAEKLAVWGSSGLLHPVAIPSEEVEHKRALVRRRNQVVKMASSCKAEIKSAYLFHGIHFPAAAKNFSRTGLRALVESAPSSLRAVIKSLVQTLEFLQEEVRRLNKEITVMAAEESHCDQVGRLTAINGVGQLTAITIILELFDPWRFERREQVAKIAGLSPGVHQSGEMRQRGAVARSGNPRLKRTLIEAAWSWVRYDKDARTLHNRYTAQLGTKTKAIIPLARKLLIIIWRMLVTGEQYRGLPLQRKESVPATAV